MPARLTDLDPDTFTHRQQEIVDDILSRRGGIRGPFLAWIRTPELAERAQKLGAYCRYDTALPPVLSELAILVVARHWRAQAEWAIHAPIAQKAGVEAQDIATILDGGDPAFSDAAMQVVYGYTQELLATARIGEDTHARAIAVLGEAGVVDLVALIGYYGLVALTLNAFDMPVPPGADRPFEDEQRATETTEK